MNKTIMIFLTVLTLSACTRDEEIIRFSRSFQLNEFDNLFITKDRGVIIAGFYNQKFTLIKTDENFNILWTKNNYEWATSNVGMNLINIFQRSDGSYICFCLVSDIFEYPYYRTLVFELTPEGERIQIVELFPMNTKNVIQTKDGGYLLLGSSIRKIDDNYEMLCEIDNMNGPYNYYQIAATIDGGFAATGQYQSEDEDHPENIFLKNLNSDGIEQSGFLYYYNDYAFGDAGYDIVQLEDLGFIIIGRTYNMDVLPELDCEIIRTNSEGDTVWTKSFGDSGNDWLNNIISVYQDEFIIQKGENISDKQSVLYKFNLDGQILDTIRMDRFKKLVYSPLNYYIKAQVVDSSHINILKISPDKLFSLK